MAISYPLVLPSTTRFRSIQWLDQGSVGISVSPYTAEQQVQRWPAQSWSVQVALPPMTDASAGEWIAVFLALNGPEGTFYLGDSVRPTRRGTLAGTVTVNTGGAAANSTTIPLTGGTGAFALGDWLQMGNGSAAKLHRVIQVNAGSVDVFPRLRSTYAAGSGVTYTNTRGVFRLAQRAPWMFDPRKICEGFSFSAIEAL